MSYADGVQIVDALRQALAFLEADRFDTYYEPEPELVATVRAALAKAEAIPCVWGMEDLMQVAEKAKP